MAEGINHASAMQTATQAGAIGVGPKVLWSDVETGSIAMERLSDGWITARQSDLQSDATVGVALGAVKAFHGTDTLPVRYDAFARIDDLIAAHGTCGVALPDDIIWLRRVIGLAQDALVQDAVLVTCRNDGSASNLMEQTIETVLRDAPLFKGGADMVYGPVSGGISNENWRVKDTKGTGDWFVKIPGNGTEMFVDRATALDASQKAAGAGLGSRVYDDVAYRGIEINDFLPNRRPSANSDFANLDLCKAAVGAYKTLHGLPALGLTKTVFGMIDEHLCQVHDLGAPMYKDAAWILLNADLARDAVHASGLDFLTSFNDPMPGNFMIDNGVQLC